MIGARDDSIAGDPCYRSLRVRGSLRIPRPGPEGKITDAELIALAVAQAAIGDPLGSQVPGADRLPACGLVFPPARPIAIQPAPAPADAADHGGAARGRRARRRGRDPAGRRHADQLRQLSRLRLAAATSRAHACYGYSPSKSQFVWGMRLVVFSDPRGSRSAMTWSAPRPVRSASRWSSSPAASRQHPVLRQGAVGHASSSEHSSSPRSSSSPRPPPARATPPSRARERRGSDWPSSPCSRT